MGRQQGWLTGREPGGGRRAPAPSRLARLRSCGERARRHEPLQKRKRTSSSELWPRPSARTGTSCERRRQPRAPAARARLPQLARLQPPARAARLPREGEGEGEGGGGAGWGGGRRALPPHERATRSPGRRRSHARCQPCPAPPRRPLTYPADGRPGASGSARGLRGWQGCGARGPQRPWRRCSAGREQPELATGQAAQRDEVEPQGGSGHPGGLRWREPGRRWGHGGQEIRETMVSQCWLGGSSGRA